MKRLIEFPLANGTDSVTVEVEDVEGSGPRPVGRNDKPVKSEKTFEAALEKIKPAAESIITKLRSLSERPDEVEVEFGLKMSAEAGAFVASASTEANYTITLKWVRESEPKKSA